MLTPSATWGQTLNQDIPGVTRFTALPLNTPLPSDPSWTPLPHDSSCDAGLADHLEADRRAVSLKATLERIALPLARAAAVFLDTKVWFDFGYARLEDHARERFGRSGRWVRDLASLGQAIQRFPSLATAMTGADGGVPLGQVAAMLVGKIAADDSLDAWIDRARHVSVRQLKDEIKQARKAGSPALPNTSSSNMKSEPASTLSDPSSEQSDTSEHRKIRFLLPKAVKAAFYETLELYRAVEGQQSGITSFIEALVAESATGPQPQDVESIPLPPDRQEGPARERALAQATNNWSSLQVSAAVGPGASPGLGATEVLGKAKERVSEPFEVSVSLLSNPAYFHDKCIRRLIAFEEELQQELGRLLARMGEGGTWSLLRFAGLGHYAEQRLGVARNTAGERAQLARALRYLPRVKQAYDQSDIGFVAALTIVRLLGSGPVDDDTQRAWVKRARSVTIKRFKDEARALQRDRATQAEGSDTSLSGCNSTDCHGEMEHPQPMDDAMWHQSLKREYGMARRRVLRFGVLATNSQSPETVLSLRLPEEIAERFLGAVESARRRATLAASIDESLEVCLGAVSDELPSLQAARTFSHLEQPLPAWVGLLVLLEEFVLTWDVTEPGRKRRHEAIYIRDGWRCMTPGCSSRRNLEDHHVVYRSRGGNNEHSNRICLCRFHHQRGEHGELATCRGVAPLGLIWNLGRGGRAGRFQNEMYLKH